MDPLSLLGQYSDEDEEEEQLSQANETKKKGSANIVAGQVEEQVNTDCIHKSLIPLSTIIQWHWIIAFIVKHSIVLCISLL